MNWIIAIVIAIVVLAAIIVFALYCVERAVNDNAWRDL